MTRQLPIRTEKKSIRPCCKHRIGNRLIWRSQEGTDACDNRDDDIAERSTLRGSNICPAPCSVSKYGRQKRGGREDNAADFYSGASYLVDDAVAS
jgi:hypothetical protein